MAKPSKHETVRCAHFAWRLVNRNGMWYADGRSNTPSAGRHSLGTKDEQEALRLLTELDRVRAEDLGLILRSAEPTRQRKSLPLDEGRKLYEQHTGRPRVTGGVRASTQKRYRVVFDKFIPFAISLGVTVWNGVSESLLNKYTAERSTAGTEERSQPQFSNSLQLIRGAPASTSEERLCVPRFSRWSHQIGHGLSHPRP